jgi:hypothetical protein
VKLQGAVSSDIAAELDRRGFVLYPAAVAPGDLDQLLGLIVSAPAPARQRGGATYAIRSLLSGRPEIVPLLEGAGIDSVASTALGTAATPVDATFFDKNMGTNWKVPAHQDLIVPARAAPSDCPAIERFGGRYAEAPEEVLRSLVAIRIHFDHCPAENGALAVIPGSHRRRMTDRELAALDRKAFVTIPAGIGDLLTLRPLLVHRSSPATQPGHRRVLQVLYAPRRGR